MTSLDWTIVAVTLVLCYAPALWYLRRAGSSTTEFFTSGRAAPWWLVGTSMVATTFSTDTPNLVTDFVRSHGVAYNWVWWSFLLTGMATVFFYARLWRRSGVLTDLEFYELRYSGKPAAFVRGFRAIYLGLVFNIVIMSAVTLAAVKIANVMLGLGRLETIVIAGTACVISTSLAGLWGVIATDVVQFALAMVGVIGAAYFALDHPAVGGLSGLLRQTDPATLALIPDFGDPALALSVLVIPLTVQWWSVWYPGAEPGGGSYIAQRILASKNERHALGATLWFNVAHYALRPWPWIIVALCSMVVYPTLDDIRRALPHVDPALVGHDLAYPAMLTLLPAGMKGLLIASLFAAYRSTVETHLNWGASYLVIDFYQRFLAPGRTERHYLWVSRALTVMLMVACGAFTLALSTASEAFQLLLSIGAGTGLIYLLRWFWWRINAWSEIAAMASSLLIALGLFVARKQGVPISTEAALLVTVGLTTVVWVGVTLATSPVDRATLRRFYLLTRPAGPGWRAIREDGDLPPSPDSIPVMLLGWTLGITFVYAGLFGTGTALYGQMAIAMIWLVVFLASGAGLYWVIARLWSTAPEPAGPAAAATKAVILAAGLGTRMRTSDGRVALVPAQTAAADRGMKAMMPVGRPFLDYLLSALADAGLTEVCIVIGPDHGAIREYYTSEAAVQRLRITFALQAEPLGTANAVLAAEAFVGGEPFLVLNGDNLYPAQALTALRSLPAPATVGFTRGGLLRDGSLSPARIAKYGLLDVGSNGRLYRVIEKPGASVDGGAADDMLVSMNCWLFDSRIFPACRAVSPSPRGELELPLAVQYAIETEGMEVTVAVIDAPVPDLSYRGDIPALTARLRGVEVRL